MKVNIVIDCTPEEARTFLGLPDVQPMQAAVMAQLEKQMLDSITALSPDALLKSWLGMGTTGGDQMRDAFMGLMKSGFPGSR